MSRIYAGGTKATAISNLIADIGGYISYDGSGRKVVDTAGLTGYLQAQLNLVVSGAEYVSPATAASATAAIKAVNIEGIVQTLSNAVGPTAWSSRPDWPTQSSVMSGSTIVAAVKQGFSALQVLADNISNYYTSVDVWAKQILADYYASASLDSAIPAGITVLTESRAVIHTYVTDRGQESAPSPASAVFALDQNDTATYTAAAIPTGRFISKIRWYRSVSGNQGNGFEFVADVSGGVLTYTDSKKATELGGTCPTTLWAEPRSDLRGLIEGPNGGGAGFVGNRVCPWVNGAPYAYAREHEKTTAWPIVGLGRFGNNYVVTTLGNPYYMAGSDGSALDAREFRNGLACVSRRSIASDASAVYYACARGIVRADASGMAVITDENGFNLYDLDDWAKLVPSTIIACIHNGAYIFQVGTSTKTMYSLDLKTGKLVQIDAAASAFYVDPIADRVYYANAGTIVSLFGGTVGRTGVWRSKMVKHASVVNAGWLQVDSDFSSSVQVKIWRDGVLTDTKIVTSKKPVRVKPVSAVDYEYEVTSTARVTSFTVASSSEEIRSVGAA